MWAVGTQKVIKVFVSDKNVNILSVTGEVDLVFLVLKHIADVLSDNAMCGKFIVISENCWHVHQHEARLLFLCVFSNVLLSVYTKIYFTHDQSILKHILFVFTKLLSAFNSIYEF